MTLTILRAAFLLGRSETARSEPAAHDLLFPWGGASIKGLFSLMTVRCGTGDDTLRRNDTLSLHPASRIKDHRTGDGAQSRKHDPSMLTLTSPAFFLICTGLLIQSSLAGPVFGFAEAMLFGADRAVQVAFAVALNGALLQYRRVGQERAAISEGLSP